MFRKLWTVFWRPSTKWGLGVLLIAGIFFGVAGWNVFHFALEQTTSTEFCIGCHSMRDNNFEEFKTTIHYSNPAGVRATCSDCHVPKGGWELYVAKLMAAKDVWGEITGTIDTREKFEEKRLEMAETVWADMKANDSRGCRTCHSFGAMDFEHQSSEAAAQMQVAMNDGSTCIDCHKGIAHHLPDMTSGYKKTVSDLLAQAESLKPKADETLYTIETIEFYADKPSDDDERAAGKILPATALAVRKVDGEWLEVDVTGWQQEGAERMIYALQGKRIFNAAMTPAETERVVQGQVILDPDTEQNWNEATLTLWVKNAYLTDNLDELWNYGEQMYGAACALCHTLREPGHYLANQWIGTLNAMKPKTPLDDEQFRFLQKYVQMHAKDVAEGGAH